jgi:RimJ/RimL family protein N-acetyltransferase
MGPTTKGIPVEAVDEGNLSPEPPPRPRQGFVIRASRPGDARSFLEMWEQVVAERVYVRSDTVRQSARFYRRRFRDSWTEDHASLVAVSGDRVIGHLEVSREEGPITRHVASIGMAVAHDWRGRGVGRELMAECIRWAASAGVEKLALTVYPHNQPARALYAKFGFVEEGRLTGHSHKAAGYFDEIVMGKWLVERPSLQDG